MAEEAQAADADLTDDVMAEGENENPAEPEEAVEAAVEEAAASEPQASDASGGYAKGGAAPLDAQSDETEAPASDEEKS